MQPHACTVYGEGPRGNLRCRSPAVRPQRQRAAWTESLRCALPDALKLRPRAAAACLGDPMGDDLRCERGAEDWRGWRLERRGDEPPRSTWRLARSGAELPRPAIDLRTGSRDG